MQMDEQLIALVTQKVLEALGQNAPAANEAETPEGAVKGIQGPAMLLSEKEEAKPGSTPDEVVIGIAPAFALSQKETICGLSHADVLREITAGIEEEGLRTRYVRFRDISDVSFIAQRAAKLSGSGIGIGIQSKGTAVIHQKDIYRRIGKNAARYAKGQSPVPIEVTNDCMVRPKYQARAAILHIKETEHVQDGAPPVELEVKWRDG